MSEDQPVLFDMPGYDQPSRSDRPRPGKNRETWACTVTTEVTVVDAKALRDAAEQAEESTVANGFHADPAADDPAAEATGESFDILAWLVWPTDGLEDLLEADALQILGVETEVAAESDDACTLTWTVRVMLDDVAEVRRLAARAHPENAGGIAGDFALAWQHAVDVFAPLRSIPGIAWQPTEVVVHRAPRRGRPGNAYPI